MIGRTISHYRILEKLGEGGMGVVYKALDLKLERLVALKFLPHEITIGEDDKARFLQEAKAASAISHPNVCVIHDILESDGQQFIVMEYVEGKTLRQVVPISKVQDALGYAIQIGEALAEAHAKGIVHRDIKTDNIMVNVNNQIKVMDFGLAKLRGSLKLTRTSSTVGTLSYMAPEQIQGGEVDARSDIFSFGVVLYEVLAGQLPFVGDHEAAMMYSILNESPQPVQKFRPELSSEVLHIVNRALEKDPEDRYQSMRDMVIDLRRAKKETSRVSRAAMGVVPSESARAAARYGAAAPEERGAPSGQRPILDQATQGMRSGKVRRRNLLWIALAVILAAGAMAVFVLTPRRAPTLNPNLSFRTLEIPFSQIEAAGLSRDGGWLAFDVRDPSTDFCSVYFMNVTKGNPQRLTAEPYRVIFSTEVSPDGSDVLFDAYIGIRPCAIFMVSSLGGATRLIAEPGIYGRWRPDGQIIGYIRDAFNAPSESGKREFWTVKPDGSENHLEFVDSLSSVFASTSFSATSFDWSPDGTSIAWLRSAPDYSEIIIRDLRSGAERQLTGFKMRIEYVRWASNDQIFFSCAKSGNTNIWMIPARGGEAVQVTKGAGPDYGAAVSGDTKRLLYAEAREISHIWVSDIGGRNPVQLTFDNQGLGSPSMSPDRKRICFYMWSEGALHPTSYVCTMKRDGSDRTQLRGGDVLYGCPVWSPDGEHIAYCAFRMNEPMDSCRVYVIDVANPSSPRLIGRGRIFLWANADEIVTMSYYLRANSFRYSIHEREPLEVNPALAARIPLSDGRHTLVADQRPGHEGWWLETAGAPAGAARKLLVPALYFDSTWPSASLRYLLSRQANAELWRISILDGRRERLPEFLNGRNPCEFEVQTSYDDKEIVFAKGQTESKLVLIDNLFK